VELFWGYGKALEMGREWPMTVKTPATPLCSLVLFFAKKKGRWLSLGGVVQSVSVASLLLSVEGLKGEGKVRRWFKSKRGSLCVSARAQKRK
jgi:hypothetical protein